MEVKIFGINISKSSELVCSDFDYDTYGACDTELVLSEPLFAGLQVLHDDSKTHRAFCSTVQEADGKVQYRNV